MTFSIITHALHTEVDRDIFAYGPYVKEMNIWLKYVDDVVIVAPVVEEVKSSIHLSYLHKKLKVLSIPAISLISFKEIIYTIFRLPIIFLRIFNAMRTADHIHLRCPGNIGLLGCLVQVFFPKKKKTAKYAGNWDPKAKQPLSYRFQKWILSNTFLTKNMKVLVYGEWPNQTKNIIPFFTASYEKDKSKEVEIKTFSTPFKCLFVGTLSHGKRPEYAIALIQQLKLNGIDVSLEIYGDGVERTKLESLIKKAALTETIILHGNQAPTVIEDAYKRSDFLILPSKSEGWPKVVAEAMFWGVIPIVPKISCVPWMLEYGRRGVLLNVILKDDVKAIMDLVLNKESLQQMSKEAQNWSQLYTLDDFESEIKKLV